MLDQKPPSFLQNLSRWLVPIGAVIVLAAWIYIAPPGLLGKLDAVGYAVCHRLDSHSLHIGSIQLPLCARCTGEFNAAAIALVFQSFVSRRRSKLPGRGIAAILILFFLAFAIDGSNSYLALLKTSYAGAFSNIPNLYTTNNVTRLFTGSGMGIAMAAVLYPMYNQSLWRQQEEQRALDWRKFGILTGAIFLIDLASLTESPIILYPVAIISALGVIALLTLVFSIVWIMVMKEENTFDRLRQLWIPIGAGLTLTFLLILAIDLFRYSLTHTWQGFPGLTG
jgi:uncharacterized membrane protein